MAADKIDFGLESSATEDEYAYVRSEIQWEVINDQEGDGANVKECIVWGIRGKNMFADLSPGLTESTSSNPIWSLALAC